MISAAYVLFTAIGLAFIGGCLGSYYQRMPRVGYAFIAVPLVLVIWLTIAAATSLPECIDVTYHPVKKLELPNDTVMDYCVVNNQTVNLNASLGVSLPDGGEVARLEYEKKALGISFGNSTKYKLIGRRD